MYKNFADPVPFPVLTSFGAGSLASKTSFILFRAACVGAGPPLELLLGCGLAGGRSAMGMGAVDPPGG